MVLEENLDFCLCPQTLRKIQFFFTKIDFCLKNGRTFANCFFFFFKETKSFALFIFTGKKLKCQQILPKILILTETAVDRRKQETKLFYFIFFFGWHSWTGFFILFS